MPLRNPYRLEPERKTEKWQNNGDLDKYDWRVIEGLQITRNYCSRQDGKEKNPQQETIYLAKVHNNDNKL